MLFEMVLNLIAPYYFLDGIKYVEVNNDLEITTEYEINDILLWFSFVRVYLLLKLYLYTTLFMNPRSHRIC